MDRICKPAFIYLVVAIIMLIIGVIIRFDSFNLGATFSQLSSIILCTIILAALCNMGTPEISWVITFIFLLCTLSALVAMVMNLFTPAAPRGYYEPTDYAVNSNPNAPPQEHIPTY